MDWYSAHVYYYDRKQDDLLLDAVRPLFAELAAIDGVSRCYWQRHWRLGPHVRLNVRTTPQIWAGRVQPLIDRIIGDHLRDRPSVGGASPDRDLPMHRQLAHLEQEPGPLTPWQPDNSIRYTDYDRRLHVLGTPQSSDMLADFHTDATPLAFAALDRARRTGDRFDVPVMFMVASAARGCPPIERGFLSYRSHAEGFLANSSDPAGFRERFERLYRSNAGTLRRQMDAVLAALDGGPSGLLGEWAALVDTVRERALRLHRSGDLVLQPVVPPPEAAAPPTPFGNVSPFHRALLGNEEVRTELATAEWFAVYRVVLNYQYLLFNRFGLVPLERFTLCYLVARTVEETRGITIPDIFDPADLMAGPARDSR